ncbi:lectin-related protein [Prunus dulcis]|uniref:Lectin-related protein n=1 Tax=Prunus dulcis TaxID=3755 RepID=A0A4Y1RNK7_PRUDU|nr:lectin-related protein [Prunus dulcis]
MSKVNQDDDEMTTFKYYFIKEWDGRRVLKRWGWGGHQLMRPHSHRHSQQNQLSTMLSQMTYLDHKSNKCFLEYAKALDITCWFLWALGLGAQTASLYLENQSVLVYCLETLVTGAGCKKPGTKNIFLLSGRYIFSTTLPAFLSVYNDVCTVIISRHSHKRRSVCHTNAISYLRFHCSDGPTEAAELLKVCWLEVRGKLTTTKLSPGIRYEIYSRATALKLHHEIVFVVKLQAKAYGWDVPISDGVNLTDKAREQWIEILVGNFIASPQKPGDIEFSLYEYDGRWKSGLVIKGVVVRPKY